ncbi:MAG: hypothetical protein V4659_13795 [Pseudomonadota bacterium]
MRRGRRGIERQPGIGQRRRLCVDRAELRGDQPAEIDLLARQQLADLFKAEQARLSATAAFSRASSPRP